MRFRIPALIVALLLAGCGHPDYTAVRDWGRTASFAADFPPAATVVAAPGTWARPADRAQLEVGILAMQEALTLYLTSLSTWAGDGLLPYREDPLRGQAERAAPVSVPARDAIAALGEQLRKATLENSRAPEMRDAIATADPHVQVLVTALSDAVAQVERAQQAERDAVTRLFRGGTAQGPNATLRWVVEREIGLQVAARATYRTILTRIAEGHALLKARARRITQAEAIRLIRASEDQIRRASETLPRALASVPPPAGS